MLQKILKHKNDLFSLLGNLSSAAFGFLTFISIVRFTNNELFGRWIIYITIATLLDMFRTGLTGTACIRLMAGETDNKAKQKIFKTANQIALLLTVVISVFFFSMWLILNKNSHINYYTPILLYYPILALANFPFHQLLIYSQAKMNFKFYFKLKGLQSLFFLIVTLFYITIFQPSVNGLIITHIISFALISICLLFSQHKKLSVFGRINKTTRKLILGFGKYATASYIGSNLLRSADTIMLSAAASMGAEAVAILAIPMKFVEIVEIPLRSFTTSAYPKLALAIKNNTEIFNRILKSYIFRLSMLIIPASMLLLIFSKTALQLLGTSPNSDAFVLQQKLTAVICFYILLLPFDRFLGVSLFALNKPHLNFMKIFIMLLANVILNIIAIYIFKSLLLVTAGTVIFTIVGIIVGFRLTAKQSGLTLLDSFSLLKKNVELITKVLKVQKA